MDWKKEFSDFLLRENENIDYLAETTTQAKTKDVGLINQESGSGIIIGEDGSIECSSDYGIGFRMDPKYKSILISAPNIHIFSDNIQKHAAIVDGEYISNEFKDVLALVQGVKDNG